MLFVRELSLTVRGARPLFEVHAHSLVAATAAVAFYSFCSFCSPPPPLPLLHLLLLLRASCSLFLLSNYYYCYSAILLLSLTTCSRKSYTHTPTPTHNRQKIKIKFYIRSGKHDVAHTTTQGRAGPWERRQWQCHQMKWIRLYKMPRPRVSGASAPARDRCQRHAKRPACLCAPSIHFSEIVTQMSRWPEGRARATTMAAAAVREYEWTNYTRAHDEQ